MSTISGAHALIKALEHEGVDTIFGVPGGAILPAYDPLLDSPIRHILVRHEQGAGHMAEGYAWATGRVGVCIVTSGPGATNLVTPITDAYMDSVPLVAITGQVGSTRVGTDAFQEADIVGITMPITIASGKHPSPNGGNEKLPAFKISACEVTIGEYQEFLETLELLDPESRTIYDAKDQPAEKSGHEPKDWADMLSAAKEGGTWDGRPIDLFCPITLIDWWDAVAYCDWKGGRLPTQEEWFAALREKVEKPEFLQPAKWGPVTSISMDDKTLNGLFGMAGSVAEWTSRPASNPANPLGRKQFVIIGASFLKSDNGALAREWTDDRLQRRPDLGFRIVWSAK